MNYDMFSAQLQWRYKPAGQAGVHVTWEGLQTVWCKARWGRVGMALAWVRSWDSASICNCQNGLERKWTRGWEGSLFEKVTLEFNSQNLHEKCSYNASADKAGVGGSLGNQRAPMKTLSKTQGAGLHMYPFTHACTYVCTDRNNKSFL